MAATAHTTDEIAPRRKPLIKRYLAQIILVAVIAILFGVWVAHYFVQYSPKSKAAWQQIDLPAKQINDSRQSVQTSQFRPPDTPIQTTETAEFNNEIYLADAGFELPPTDTSVWVPTSSGGFGIIYGGPEARTGRQYAWFGGVSVVENETLSQTITVPSGPAPVNLNFYLWLEHHSNHGTPDYLSVRLNNNEVWRVDDSNHNYDAGYRLVSIPVSAALGNNIPLEFVYHNDNSGNNHYVNFLVDDVFLTTGNHTVCQNAYQDLSMSYDLYPYLQYLGCHNLVSSYTCGGPGEQCFQGNAPYIRPVAAVDRATFAQTLSNTKGYAESFGQGYSFADVPLNHPAYLYAERLRLHNIVAGYSCGGAGEPCDAQRRPYFRPGSPTTRAQAVKMAAIAAGYTETPTSQAFADVPPSNPSYLYIERLAMHSIVNGYPCGGAQEPCDAQNRPYFRPNVNVTNQQAAKIVVKALGPQ